MGFVLTGLPKSANVYIRLAIAKTLGESAAHADLPLLEMDGIFSHPVARTERHLRATARNLQAFRNAVVGKIAVLVRDPRDAIISWWHHMEREDVRADGLALSALIKDGLAPSDYYDLALTPKLDTLIASLMPHFQSWLREWLQAKPEGIEVRFFRYEDFARNQAEGVRSILQFFGYNDEPALPPERLGRGAGIDQTTHFREGLVGSFFRETNQEQYDAASKLIDAHLYQQFNWTAPREAKMQPQTLTLNYTYIGVPITVTCTDEEEGTGHWEALIKGEAVKCRRSFSTSVPELLHDAMFFIEEEFSGKIDDVARDRINREFQQAMAKAPTR